MHSTPSEKESLQNKAIDLVENRWESFTPNELEKSLSAGFGLSRKESRKILKALVMDGRLAYRDRHGRTIIEKSFDRAVRVSRRIVLKPPEALFIPEKNDVVIQLRHGASFGTGSHPTTRMALRGIEHALGSIDFDTSRETTALDIGTGSGVLGIGAIGLGIGRVVGLDIDPCAVSEAEENARINGMQERFKIRKGSIEEMEEPVDLILANLRLPTLFRIFSHFLRLTSDKCGVVISGMKVDETPDLVDIFGSHGFESIWEETQKDWAALVFRGKTDLLGTRAGGTPSV